MGHDVKCQWKRKVNGEGWVLTGGVALGVLCLTLGEFEGKVTMANRLFVHGCTTCLGQALGQAQGRPFETAVARGEGSKGCD